VHGAVCDHSVWTLLARWFAHHGHGVLAVDLPGHKRSEGPALACVEDMADWLLALLQAAGVQRAALAGHSMGSLIALEAAARAPALASQLLMLGSSVPMPVPQALLDLARNNVPAAIHRVVAHAFSSLAPKPSFPGPGVWLRGAARGMMHQVVAAQGDALLFHTDFTACNAYTRGLETAAQVRCPATLVLGSADQMTPHLNARAVAERLGATVHTLPVGHFVMQEAPDAVLACLRQALQAPPAWTC
jgi:pimeloyl-ACP methyl ester carboxylesterase